MHIHVCIYIYCVYIYIVYIYNVCIHIYPYIYRTQTEYINTLHYTEVHYITGKQPARDTYIQADIHLLCSYMIWYNLICYIVHVCTLYMCIFYLHNTHTVYIYTYMYIIHILFLVHMKRFSQLCWINVCWTMLLLNNIYI